ncbi:unnamed protein product [Caenorhabditis bovis]|uniref:Uncharacterized protein n=1 Tax=Caenorhabditis bovis TaxID=2654633 RepID=A0A8S1FBV7_9PELO|nr:unnamed protein product [Caenorhabditis bovis]
MNRLVTASRIVRSYTTAAPKISTGIEHAEKAKQRQGGKPDWSLYKCDDYLKFDKYSFAQAEVTMEKDRVPQPSYKRADEMPKMTSFEHHEIKALHGKSNHDVLKFFADWNSKNKNLQSFGHIDYFAREEFAKLITAKRNETELAATFIETIRLLAREKTGIETLMTPDVCDFVLFNAGLPVKDGFEITQTNLHEAQKCLINTLFNSSKMRERFEHHAENSDLLISYLFELDTSKRNESAHKWIIPFPNDAAEEIWFLYHRIAFIVTALSRKLQNLWAHKDNTVDCLLLAVESLNANKNAKQIDYLRANEAMKTLFNVYCHASDDSLSKDKVRKINKALYNVVVAEDNSYNDETKQAAINSFSLPPVFPDIEILCTSPNSSTSGENFDDMTFTDKLLKYLESRLNELPPVASQTTSCTAADLIGPYFTTLSRLCRDSKYARRYCRMKILPPLKDKEVEKRPEEEDSLRGKIVRFMMMPTCAKDIAAQFLFVLCKKSVARMIKYTGFGHSAGLLANMGLLGQINEPKHDSDSEDSETEEYNSVKDNVNPVTGSLFPPDRGSFLEGMSEEQKEYEAMKLVDAMNKMMDAGIVKPGTIGEDGRVREVSHVLELTKNMPDVKDDSDSD